jgi:hypothetical protein
MGGCSLQWLSASCLVSDEGRGGPNKNSCQLLVRCATCKSPVYRLVFQWYFGLHNDVNLQHLNLFAWVMQVYGYILQFWVKWVLWT